MKDGVYSYQFNMRVPLGIRPGELRLRFSGGISEGELTIFGKTRALSGLCYSKGQLDARGVLDTLLYPLPFELHGVVDEETVSLEMATAKGNFMIKGARI